MIDNLKLIESIIDFPNEDTFYKIEIIVRRKDNPDLYENDVFGRVIKRNKDSIWKRGNMKRIKHKEDE